jgi:4-amino-4-deoxy-L-arabinose transferase-like glycosyltransferase
MPPERPSGGRRPSLRMKRIILVLLLLAGTAMRMYKFPSLPVGLHQDEISEAYESYSLLHTGADRWGYHLPVYFLSWGSGQNVLQSYLSIPVIAITGLTRVGARLIPLLCGILCLPLLFLTVRRWHGEAAAFLALFFLAFSPWQVMLSRWGIENSPLPFFMLLGLFTFGKALDSSSYWVILPSLLPFSLAFYTYGIVVAFIPPLLVFLFLIDPRSIAKAKAAWLSAFGLFSVLSLPIAFFVLKNYITKTNYSFERWLPFSVPLLPITRLAEAEKIESTPFRQNFLFLRHGLYDNTTWFEVPGFHPLPSIVLFLAAIGIAYLGWRLLCERRLSEPFLPWLFACIPLLIGIPLNNSRGIVLFVPLLALAGVGFVVVFDRFRRPACNATWAFVCILLFLIPTIRFIHAYFGRTYASEIADTFYPELPEAFQVVQKLATTSTPVYVSHEITLNYLQTLYFMKIDPSVFQHSGATYNHPDFGPYRFSRASLAETPKPFVFLLRSNESPLCAASNTVNVGQFVVGECR